MSGQRILRLCIVTSDYHYCHNGCVYTTSAFMRFVPELLSLAQQIEVCAPVHPEPEPGGIGFTIEAPSITYRPLAPSRTLEEFLRRFPRDGVSEVHSIYEGIQRADLIWINGPHPLLPLTALLARSLHKPYLLWLRGDILATVRSKYTRADHRNRLAARTALYLDKLIHASARGAPLFYTGRGLERYATGARYSQAVATSLVRESELALESRTGVHSPVRLLWAGQLRPVKGLPVLLRAVRTLLDGGVPVRLRIVGSGEQRAVLEAECNSLRLRESVSLEGYVSPGPGLNRYFEEADLFVLPSLSEGVPKVLIEAMARALPVVATAVGGIPDVVEDRTNGLLVPPGSPAALAEAVAELHADDGLRRRLSEGALEFARLHTAQAEVERIGWGLHSAFPRL